MFMLFLDCQCSFHSFSSDLFDFAEQLTVHGYALSKITPIETIDFADFYGYDTRDSSLILNQESYLTKVSTVVQMTNLLRALMELTFIRPEKYRLF